MISMIKTVIFDMDGVVVDTAQLNFVADSKVLNSVGLNISKGEYLKHTGKPGRQIYDEILKQHGVTADLEALVAKREEYIKKAIEELNLKPNPGFHELVAKLRANNYIVALASSSSKTKVWNVLNFLKLGNTFVTVVTGSDVTKTKPAPDIYLEVAGRLKLKPDECVVVEDSETGILAAKNAGMVCIALLTEHTKNQDVSIADKIVDSLSKIDVNDFQELSRRGGLI
ncbi:HAD family phosphatase [Candidatus Woesearchaeota archaeon]|nr:HAD family phosphatase [Candidatus Woesearchaeota archaeon]